MMTQIPDVDLRKVKTRCEKKKCCTRDFVLHRHHKACQSLFVHAFVHRANEKKYKAFVRRYYSFDERDIVRICSSHHREIHERYDLIIADYCFKLHKSLSDFSWNDAEKLMALLVAECNDWLKKRTKGSKVPWPSNGKTKRKAMDFLEVLNEHAEDLPLEEAVENLNDIPF